MKRRRDVKDGKIILNEKFVKISIETNNEIYFEINNNHVTTDIAEAVSIFMNIDVDSSIWNIEVPKGCQIDPEKSLYWLSGGNKEWATLDNYNNSWINCYSEFNDEFGHIILKIIESAKTLNDIKNGFIKYLSLPILYDFSIRKGFIRW